MLILDSQVHPYERNHPARPWAGTLAGPASATGDELIAAMDEAGVHGALLVSAYSFYRYDASYAQQVYAAHRDRFRVIKPVDPTNPGVADTIAQWAATPGAVGVRLLLDYGATEDPADPGMARVLAAAARHGLPVNLLCWGRPAQAQALIARHPDTTIVIDHLGLLQPMQRPAPAAPWAGLPQVLALARYPNVRIKVSGACTLSHAPFPFPDIWDNLARVFDAFGLDRCLWGTDWTRAVEFLTYREGVEAFLATGRLSATDKATLMGGTLQRVYGWRFGQD